MNYQQHFLMDTETVKDYAKNVIKYFSQDEEIVAKEIGDGNINYVFLVYSKNTDRSVVIKQADKLLRSSGRPLDVYRSKIEAEILQIQKKLAPKFIPDIYNYNEIMCALSMENISDYKNMRTELMAGKIFPDFANEFSEYLSAVLLPTTDLCMDRAEKKDNVKLFTNKELCDISEDLVFTEPYYNYKGRNIITHGQDAFVDKFLYKNYELQEAVAKLRNNFMNHSQALIHGDLHTGSLFINESGLKVIDPEFAFYGPIGYDIGNVIGNLFFSWGYVLYTNPENYEFLNWIESCIADTLDLTMKKLAKTYGNIVTFPLYRLQGFKAYYLQEILSDSLGYAGTEIIRRIVGDSKVLELKTITDSAIKIPLERSLIQLAIFLITKSNSLTKGYEITQQFKRLKVKG